MLDTKSFFVLGLGKSGMAVARLLAGKGYEIVASDDDADVVRSARDARDLTELGDRIEPVTMDLAPAALDKCGCLVVSPGVPLEHPLVRRARQTGITVTGELEIAFRFCSSPIIGVTGTNGKSTVVSLLGEVFTAAGRRVVVAGNIGTPLSAVVETGGSCDVVVLEVSSFQLDTISKFKARVAVLLNVTVDHLDRYEESFEKYASSKARILDNADDETVFVFNDEDAVCRRIAKGYQGAKIPFSSSRELDVGVYAREGTIVRSWKGTTEPVLAIEDFSPIGIHNLENAMASVAAATPFEVDVASIKLALENYRPLSHRMEPVKIVDGVTYINDSKATNVDATVKSLRSIDGVVVLILGGLDKSGDFGLLREHLDHVKRVILIGDAKEKIRKALTGSCRILDAGDLEEAVREAARIAKAGDTVLLAPACASFDMFENYAQRGEVFRAAVNAL
ncbi:MAG: UDP-N-acetylmuramoyl-L-alanine--D-glutamate ligase [Candidatus Latescibacterota bacterium]|nr:MAG: UDP-N-acetylmuramoyl-L-alanine--D-glutamate ligase [Candidatus Latescibacterota bacterium]